MSEAAGASVAAVAIGLDRQERGKGELSAIQELERERDLAVISIVGLNDIVEYLNAGAGDPELVSRVSAYRERYGVSL